MTGEFERHVSDHEREIAELGECATCGLRDASWPCVPPCGECDDCGAACEGNVCEPCARELGGEA